MKSSSSAALFLFGLAVCFAQKGNVPHGGEVSELILNNCTLLLILRNGVVWWWQLTVCSYPKGGSLKTKLV